MACNKGNEDKPAPTSEQTICHAIVGTWENYIEGTSYYDQIVFYANGEVAGMYSPFNIPNSTFEVVEDTILTIHFPFPDSYGRTNVSKTFWIDDTIDEQNRPVLLINNYSSFTMDLSIHTTALTKRL